jgi:hypothetical protein
MHAVGTAAGGGRDKVLHSLPCTAPVNRSTGLWWMKHATGSEQCYPSTSTGTHPAPRGARHNSRGTYTYDSVGVARLPPTGGPVTSNYHTWSDKRGGAREQLEVHQRTRLHTSMAAVQIVQRTDPLLC